MTAAAVIVPAILVFLGVAVIVAVVVVALSGTIRANRDKRALTADWRRTYNAQRDAIDAVIGELEAFPATYQTFPQPVREQLYAAHNQAAELKGNT